MPADAIATSIRPRSGSGGRTGSRDRGRPSSRAGLSAAADAAAVAAAGVVPGWELAGAPVAQPFAPGPHAGCQVERVGGAAAGAAGPAAAAADAQCDHLPSVTEGGCPSGIPEGRLGATAQARRARTRAISGRSPAVVIGWPAR